MNEQLIVINHVGTSILETIYSELNQLVLDVQKEWVDTDVTLTFNSRRAIKKLVNKGMDIPYFYDYIESGIMDEYKEILVLPVHFVVGHDYLELKETISGYDDNVRLLKPVLSEDKNCEKLAKIIVENLNVEDRDKPLLLVGHGTGDCIGNKHYDVLLDQVNKYHQRTKFITLKQVDNPLWIHDIKSQFGQQEIVLFPLFTVCGHHVAMDIFEGSNSIKSQLEQADVKVKIYKHGLLGYRGFRSLYIDVLRQAGV